MVCDELAVKPETIVNEEEVVVPLESNERPKEESGTPTLEAKIQANNKTRRTSLDLLRLAEKQHLPHLMLSSKRCSTMTKVMAKYAMGSPTADHSDFSALNIDVQPSALPSRPKAGKVDSRAGVAGLFNPLRSGGFVRQITSPAAISRIAAPAPLDRVRPQASAFFPPTPRATQEAEPMDFRHMALNMRSHVSLRKPEELERYSLQRVGSPNASPALPKNSPMQRQLTAPPDFQGLPRTPPTPTATPTCQSPASFLFNKPQLVSSPNAWKVGTKVADKYGEMKRLVQGMLNKICPESMASIAEKISKVSVHTPEELEVIIELIFKKALAEPHYCETYADLVFSLKSAFPEFPNPDGGRPITFRASVLNVCQNEFESLPTALEPTEREKEMFDEEEIEFRKKQKKVRVLANMKFIGHLFLRQLLSVKVIGSVMQELILCDSDEKLPQEHAIECACELLMTVGYTVENMPAGHNVLGQVCDRLLDLKLRKGAYSRRIQFCIQDLLDTRLAGWSKKSFKSAAKTKEEIRKEQLRDLSATADGCQTPVSAQIIAGQRPVYLASSS